MKPNLHKCKRNVLLCSALLLAALSFAAAHETRQLEAGEKARSRERFCLAMDT
jgi:cell division protein FtsL